MLSISNSDIISLFKALVTFYFVLVQSVDNSVGHTESVNIDVWYSGICRSQDYQLTHDEHEGCKTSHQGGAVEEDE